MQRPQQSLFVVLSSIIALGFGCGDPPTPPPPAGSCQNFAACGGDPSGTWSVYDVCYDTEAFRLATESAIDDPACAGWLQNTAISVVGTLRFADDVLASELVLIQLLDTVWTEACLQAITSPTAVLDAASCNAIGSSLSVDSESGTACTLAGDLCECRAEVVSSVPTSLGYTLEDGRVITARGTSDYCAADNELLFRGQAGTERPEFILLLRRG